MIFCSLQVNSAESENDLNYINSIVKGHEEDHQTNYLTGPTNVTTGYFDANEKDYDYINLKVSNIGQEPKAYQKMFERSQATVVTSQDLFKACACTLTY